MNEFSANWKAGRQARGLVVSIYLDPRNPLGSTAQTLYDLERNSGPLLS